MHRIHRPLTHALTLMLGMCALPLSGCDDPGQRPDDHAEEVALRDGESTNPCTGLTPATIQLAIDRIEDALAKAEENLIAHNPAAYAAAGEQALTSFQAARAKMISIQDWLADNQLDTPYVTNTTAVYSLHWYAREAATNLAYAEHWAAISAVYNTSDEARSAAELGAEATRLLADIGADALSCYMKPYFAP